MVHVVITAAIVIAAYFLGLHVYASFAAACFYIGREHAQAEQVWRDKVSEIKAQLPIGANPPITE